MKNIVIIFSLVPSLSFATAISSNQDGDWGTGSTWVGGVAPGNGDTVSITHAITVSDSRIVGTSPAEGNVVVNLNAAGSIRITSTGYLKVRGDVTYTAGTDNTTDAVVVDGGGIFEFDSSLAASPTAQNYAFYPNGHFGWRKFKVSGSKSATATLKANASSGMGALKMGGFAYGGPYEFFYANLSNMSFEFYYRDDNGSADPTAWNVTYSTFTGCGLISDQGGLHPGGTFIHDHNYHSGTVGGVIFDIRVGYYKSGGTRSIQYNVFDSQLSTNSGFRDFTIANNYMEDGYSSFYSSTTYDRNFIRMKSNLISAAGTFTTSYYFLDADMTNPHVINLFGDYGSSLSGIVFGQSGKANGLGGDDSGEFILPQSPTVYSTNSITNSIFLPNGNGYSSLEITTLLGSAGDSNSWTKYAFSINHNTWFGGFSNGSQFAAIDFSETTNMSPGRIDSYKSNILWNPGVKAATFLKALDIGNVASNLSAGYGTGPTQDVCAPANCNYNASFNANTTASGANVAAYTNQGKGYGGKFSSTPGTNDLDSSNPWFRDYHRNVEKFDGDYYRPYLGLSAATAWASGASYSVGNVVSHSTSTLYWGDSINYRYTNGTGCSNANPEPGAGLQSAWASCWEFASLNDIRTAIASSMTFTDSGLGVSGAGINETLIKWIRYGYTPTNTAYRATAHDGGDIGAVPMGGRAPSEIHGIQIFPTNNVWNTAIDNAPIHANNANWMDTDNGHTMHDLHAEFGSTYASRWNGIPYNLINNSTQKSTVTWATDYNYSDESDAIPAEGLPIPPDAICESDAPGFTLPLDPDSDRHCILINTDSKTLYETFGSSRIYAGGVWQSSWTIRQLSIWDLTSNALRTDTWTSADAAGLPIMPGLVNYNEVQAAIANGTYVVPHAFRFTLALTYGPYLWPARHNANSGTSVNPPFGMRVRMKSTVDTSSYSPVVRTIFNTLKKYGMFLADNGGDWFITGAPHSEWNDSDIHDSFITVGYPKDIFEVVDESTWLVDADSGEANPPSGPKSQISGSSLFYGGSIIR